MGGLGVGLTLARNMAERHGGTMEAQSAGPGEGAEFIVRLLVIQERTSGCRGPARLPL